MPTNLMYSFDSPFLSWVSLFKHDLSSDVLLYSCTLISITGLVSCGLAALFYFLSSNVKARLSLFCALLTGVRKLSREHELLGTGPSFCPLFAQLLAQWVPDPGLLLLIAIKI